MPVLAAGPPFVRPRLALAGRHMAQGAALVLCLLLSIAALFVAQRRAAGALAAPLAPWTVLLTATIAAGFAVAIRWLARQSASWADRAMRWMPTAALALLGASLWLPGTNLWAMAGFWAIVIAEESWLRGATSLERSKAIRRSGCRPRAGDGAGRIARAASFATGDSRGSRTSHLGALRSRPALASETRRPALRAAATVAPVDARPAARRTFGPAFRVAEQGGRGGRGGRRTRRTTRAAVDAGEGRRWRRRVARFVVRRLSERRPRREHS